MLKFGKSLKKNSINIGNKKCEIHEGILSICKNTGFFWGSCVGCQIYFVLWLLDFLRRANTGLFQTTEREKSINQNHKDEELWEQITLRPRENLGKLLWTLTSVRTAEQPKWQQDRGNSLVMNVSQCLCVFSQSTMRSNRGNAYSY